MIRVHYRGGTGNRLFQYCFGRILAEEMGYRLYAAPIAPFPGTKEVVRGKVRLLPRKLTDATLEKHDVFSFSKNRCVVVDGYFQKFDYYQLHAEKIRQWLRLEQAQAADANDLVVCVRRGDYGISMLPFSYYESAIESQSFNRLHLCTDSRNDPWLNQFEKYNPIVSHRDAIEDFTFVRSFKKIVCSNSTFHWWASFLNEEAQITMPIPKLGYWSPASGIDLRVANERYTYIHC